MKKHLKLFGLAMTACSIGLLPGSSHAQMGAGEGRGMGRSMMWGYGSGYEMGYGMMGAYEMGPMMMGWGNYTGLKLTAEQKANITQIRKEMRDKQWDLMEKAYAEREKLFELYDADKLDTSAINQQHQKIDELRKQMRAVAIDGQNKIRTVLTKEQLENSKKWGRGYHHMMW